jgi:hypothetical protein
MHPMLEIAILLGAVIWMMRRQPRLDPLRMRRGVIWLLVPLACVYLAAAYYSTGTFRMDGARLAVKLGFLLTAFLAGAAFRHIVVGPIPIRRWLVMLGSVSVCAAAILLL